MIRPFFTVCMWLAVFYAWMWVLARVHKLFWYTAKTPVLMSVTFYTGGVYGIFLLLGRQNRSPLLSKWVNYLIMDNDIVKSRGWDFIRKGEPKAHEITDVGEGFFLDEHDLEGVQIHDEENDDAPAANGKCDMLDFILGKAVAKKADVIKFKRAPQCLTIDYYSEGQTIDNDKIIAQDIRNKVISALKARLGKKITSSGEIYRLELIEKEKKVKYDAAFAADNDTEEIILTLS